MGLTYAEKKAEQILARYGKASTTAWAMGDRRGYAVEMALADETSDALLMISDRIKQILINQLTACSGVGSYDWSGNGACAHCGKKLTPTKSGAIRRHNIG